MTPNYFKLQNKCLECCLRTEGFFCGFSSESLALFERVKITNAYSPGSMLFIEGQPANGVYMLCRGRAKLYTCSQNGKVVILHIAKAGELLGLSAVVSESNYEVSAEVIEPCQVNYVRDADFLRLMEKNSDIAMSAVRHLCGQYQNAYHQIRSFALSSSVSDKLSNLMLEWCGSDKLDGPIQIKMSFTHEEVAEMIGTSRETVTRLLKDFKDRNLITLKGSNLYIHDPRLLSAQIGRPRGSRSWRDDGHYEM
jgi:CRP/FNR family transcriptional regulator, cyclic AMP receptor protein